MHQAANHEAPTIFVLLDVLLHNVFVTKTVVKLLQIEKVRCTVINVLCLFALFDASCWTESPRCNVLCYPRFRYVVKEIIWLKQMLRFCIFTLTGSRVLNAAQFLFIYLFIYLLIYIYIFLVGVANWHS